MASKITVRSFIAWSILPLLLIIAAGAWFALGPGFRSGHRSATLSASMPKDEFEQRIQAYLLDHPEVIVESLNRMEERQRASAETEVQAIIQSRADELFRDVDGPIAGNPNGNATLVEFFDYNCPYCRQMVPVMTQAESADPQLRIVYKEFPIPDPIPSLRPRLRLRPISRANTSRFTKPFFKFAEPLIRARSRKSPPRSASTWID